MSNPLHILRTSGLTSGDCLGGMPSNSPDNGLSPWVESDTLKCVNVLTITDCGGAMTRWTIEGDGAGLYRLTDLHNAYVGEWTAVPLNTATTLFAPQSATPGEAMGLYCCIVVDTTAHATGTLTGRTTRNMNLPERDMAETQGYRYVCRRIYATETAYITRINVTGCEFNITGVVAGTVQPTTDGDTQPAGMDTWYTSKDTSLTFTAGLSAYLWLRVMAVTGDFVAGRFAATAEILFDDDALNPHSITAHFSWMQADDSIAGVYLDLEDAGSVGTPEWTILVGTLPYALAVTELLPFSVMSGAFTGNKYGLISQPLYLGIPVAADASGNNLIVPHAPVDTYGGEDMPNATDAGGGMVRVRSYWLPDGVWKVPEKWTVYRKDFTLSGEWTSFDVACGPRRADGYYMLDSTTGPLIWGHVYLHRVTVTVDGVEGEYFTGTGGEVTIASAPPGLGEYALLGTGQTVQDGHMAAALDTDAVRTIAMESGSVVVHTAAGDLLFSASASSLHRGFYTGGRGLANGTVTGVGSDPLIVDGSDYYLCAGGNRVVKITATTITAAAFKVVGTHCPAVGPVVELGNSVYWQIYDETAGAWQTYMRVDSDGTLALGLGIIQI